MKTFVKLAAILMSVLVIVTSCSSGNEIPPLNVEGDYLVGVWEQSDYANYRVAFYPAVEDRTDESIKGDVYVANSSSVIFAGTYTIGEYYIFFEASDVGNPENMGPVYMERISDDEMSFFGENVNILSRDNGCESLIRVSDNPDDLTSEMYIPVLGFDVERGSWYGLDRDFGAVTSVRDGVNSVVIPSTFTDERGNEWTVEGLASGFGMEKDNDGTTEDNTSVKTIYLPNTITVGLSALNNLSNLSYVVMEEGNAAGYFTQDGILYQNESDGTVRLFFVPPKYNGDVRVPDGVVNFYLNNDRDINVGVLTLPASVQTLPDVLYCEYVEIDPANPVFESYNGVVYDKATGEIHCVPEYYTGRLEVRQGATALERTGLATSVYLPASVREIYGSGDSVGSFEVDPASPYFTAVDGVLFTKDMKEVVTYPSGSSRTSYSVPDGVEVIQYAGIVSSALENLILPDSVTTIENEAIIIGGTVNIPLSVTTIGNRGVRADVVNCAAPSVPSGWSSSWSTFSGTVNWGV